MQLTGKGFTVKDANLKTKITKYLLVAMTLLFLFFLLFNIQYSYEGIVGYDGYYHIKIAKNMGEKGVLSPDASLMYLPGGEQFVDHHYLYHILLIPFTFSNLIDGAKNSAIFFDMLLLMVLSYILIKLDVKNPYLWILVLFSLSETFIFRLSLPRATIPSLIILILAWYFMIKEKYIPLAGLSLLFPSFYGGYTAIFIPLSAVICSVYIRNKRFNYKVVITVISGVTLGNIINPFFPDNLKFIYLQTTAAGLFRVARGGSEWMSFAPEEFIRTQFAFIFLFLVTLYIAAIDDKKMNKEALSLFFISLPLIAISFFWRRFIELSVPFSLLFSATVFRDCTLDNITGFSKGGKKISSALVIFLTVFFSAGSYYTAKSATEEIKSDFRSPGRYSQGAKWIYENAPGIPVYLTDWDDYPELYFYNSFNRYLIGLDPAFLYIYDKEMYKIWIEINAGKYKGDLKKAFTEVFKTPLIFTDNTHGDFVRYSSGYDWIKLRYSDSYCKIYSIIP